MKIQCKVCKSNNNIENILCINCTKPLGDKEALTKKLYNRIVQLENKYQQDIYALKKDISDFNKINDSVSELLVIPDKKYTEIKEDVRETVRIQKTNTLAVVSSKTEHRKIKISKPIVPSKLELKLKEILAPLNEGIELFLDAYEKYKREGKLPIFFMTIAGIIAILFGFGYLMQLSLNSLGAYQVLVKIGMGFTSSIVLGIIGTKLSQKKETLKEYGSALISLGIILNYLMIYFMSDLGEFPMLSSGIIGFSLICINTIISIYFSLKYNAKIISVISLIGGAFAPLYLNAMGDGNLYYLYLWFLAIGSCYVAKKKNWIELNYLTFAITLGSLEFMVFNQGPSNIIYAVYYHLFAYLFFYVSLFDGFKLKNKYVKPDIIILAASLSFFLYNLYNVFENNLLALGIVYSINGVAFATILLIKWKALNRDTRLILFVVIGALIGFAIPSIFDQKLMGLFWSIEALLLVILGFYFSIPTVRKEGYILLAVAFGKLTLSSLSIVDHWNQTIWHQGLLNYIALGAVFTSNWFIGRKHIKKLIGFENALYSYTQEIVPLWLASAYFIIGYHLIGEWIFNLSIIPLFGFIYWKKYFHTKLSDLIGLSHLLLFLAGFLWSIQTTGSFHISDQKLYAQIAIIEFMASIWALKYFYKIIKTENNSTFKFTQSLRIIFFCLLPLILINFIRRNAFEFIELGLWIGVLTTYFLYKKLKYKALQTEFYLLSVIAFLLCYLEWDSVGFIAGIGFIITTVILEKAVNYEALQKSNFKEYLTILPFLLTVLIGSFIFSLDNRFLSLSLSVSSFSLLILTYFYNKIGPIKEGYKTARNIGLILNLCSILSLLYYASIFSMAISIINLVLFSVLLNNKKNWFSSLYGRHWNIAIILHQIECVLAIGIILIYMRISITSPIYSILLAIHAIIVLFIAMKNQIKILNKIAIVLFAATLLKVVFHDINGINTTQKVIVLIILGFILLSASYAYVRLSNYFEKKQNQIKQQNN